MSKNILSFNDLPHVIESEEVLEEFMSRPTAEVVDDLSDLDGDLIVLGVGGKVGPTLARMAKRANPDTRVIGVARFSDSEVRERLESWGIETIQCDLLDREQVANLPKAKNVVYMAGKKFGTDDDKSFSWAMNTYVPTLVAEAFKDSRIVVFSTLCVYPFAPVVTSGWDERVEPAPYGDYANSCVGRERMFTYFSHKNGTPGRIIRLNYAIDLRYGVLHDVASWVYNNQPIPLATGHASVIWQGDAIAQILRSLKHCETPTYPLNVGGPEATSIRSIAHAFGDRFGKAPIFEGEEASDAWVNDTGLSQRLFGYPVVPLSYMVDWVAHWMELGLPVHDKPTKYEQREGKF